VLGARDEGHHGASAMRVDRLINVLSEITLIEMMVTIGLGVTLSDVLCVSRNYGRVARAALANYIFVPAAALGLPLMFHASPMVAAGLLVAAVCPGAPYGPPFTAMAKGNVEVSVGLMVILAGSSAIVAPVLLQYLLPVVVGDIPVGIDVLKMVGTLLGAQLLPLCVGLLVRQLYPAWAERFKKPAGALSVLLNLLLLAVILFVQFRVLVEIRLVAYIGMLLLVIATVVSGWLTGGRESQDRKGMVLTTSVRNVGVGLVIVTASFPGTPAVASATAYALFQTIGIALLALAWGRLTPAGIDSVKMKAA
jgi:BASS family bile acid:Na+ symporter